MKKIYLTAVIVFGFAELIKAGDMEVLRGADFGGINLDKIAEMEVSSVKAPRFVKENAGIKSAGQYLIDKFTKVGKDLRQLRNNTVWINNEINRLEMVARKIASSGQPNHSFVHNLRGVSTAINKYPDDARKIHRDIQSLLNIAVKSDKLNSISKDMQRDARIIYYDAQFRIESAARNLERTVRSAKPEVIGHNTHWVASDITRNAGYYSEKVMSVYFIAQDLTKETQP
ncbi:MAG: hypothetical protein KAI33_02990 [Elusimicrobiales bacterium]|nr:hypothetical protein [Elusimicrobiales bacterium]